MFFLRRERYQWMILIICMSFIKGICTNCLNCVKNCFKSEEDELEEKMIELETRIRSPHKDTYSKFQMKQTSPDNQQPTTKQHLLTPLPYSEQQFSFGETSKNRFKILSFQEKNSNAHRFPNDSPEKYSTPLLLDQKQLAYSHQFSRKPSPDRQNQGYGGNLISPHSPNNRNSNNSSDSFFTMQSGSLGSSNSISRRTFRSLSKKSSQIRRAMLNSKNNKGSESSDFKSIQNRDSMLMALPSLVSADSKVQKYSEAMIEWNEKQYDSYWDSMSKQNGEAKSSQLNHFSSNTQLSTSQLHKLTSNSRLDQLVNKLQDYYMFFQPEEMIKVPDSKTSTNNSHQPISYMMSTERSKIRETKNQKYRLTSSNFQIGSKKAEPEKNENGGRNSQSSRKFQFHPDKGYYINAATNFKCSYQCESDSIYDREFAMQSHAPMNFMKLITFFCNTSNPLQFLYWFNSIEVRARLYDFNTTLLINNGIFPTLYVEQYSGLLPSKNKYQMVRQIEIVKFENEPDKEYIMQLECTYGGGVGEENGRPFKSLLRFEIGENSMVQIYSESSEIIERGTHGDYFGEQWRNIQEKLVKDKILKSLWKSDQGSKPFFSK